MPNPNMSVSSSSPAQPPAATGRKPKLKDPNELFKAAPATAPAPAPAAPQDRSQAKAPAAGNATQSVSIVDQPATEVTEADLKWFMEIQQKPADQVTPKDAERFQQILGVLQTRQQEAAARAGLTPDDMAFAQEYQLKAAQEQPVTAQETARYTNIVTRLETAAQQPAQQPVKPAQPAQAAVTPQAAQPAKPAQPAAQPAQPAGQPAQSTDATAALANLTPVVNPEVKPPVDLGPKFQELDNLLGQKQYMVFGKPANPEGVRTTGVQIWLDGKHEDRLKLAQKLVTAGQSELLARIMNHEETSELEAARMMSEKDFPVADYMKAIDDTHAYTALRALSSVATSGEKSSAAALDKAVAAFDRVWDREAPFERLKNALTAEGTWNKLPADLRTKIDKLID